MMVDPWEVNVACSYSCEGVGVAECGYLAVLGKTSMCVTLYVVYARDTV